MWNLSKSYNTRPSSFLGIERVLDAYWFDRAVMHFGTKLEQALENSVSQGKRKQPLSDAQKYARTQDTLAKWLGTDVVKKRYRDPMAGRPS
jgi:hypothetical protein